MKFHRDEIDPSWHPLFECHETVINQILEELKDVNIAPARPQIFRVFRAPLPRIQVVIVGQDPYPGVGVADGLAFSTFSHNPIPASLRNIFKEYADDLTLPIPMSPDLSPWQANGVALLNRTLTTTVGNRNAHLDQGWRELTTAAAQLLGAHGVVAILWGTHARELSPYFDHRIESPHPSPLSAHRGFFGSRPFSRANQLLIEDGRSPIDWSLK